MAIEIIDEHSVDLSPLPAKANVLDAGCRGMKFADYFRERGHIVLALDIDILPEKNYCRNGLSTKYGCRFVSDNVDPQAKKLSDKGSTRVMCIPISECEREIGGKFDLIKMDIEGEEFAILSEAKHPIATQVSVEFHAHCGQTKEQLDSLLDSLAEFYTIYNRVWEERHGAGFNYWDILLVSK